MKLASPLHAFILASAGIHAGLFLMPGSAKLALPGDTGSAMFVKLKEQQENHSTIKKPIVKNTSKSITQAQKEKSSKKVAKVKNNPQTQKAFVKQKNSISKTRVVSLIYKELNNHFTYPKIAQRRNWQGQVLLAFRLNSNGNIEDIKINHSSGYNILDQAAIISLKKIGQLPQVSSWLINGMEIQIPVVYQLTQG